VIFSGRYIRQANKNFSDITYINSSSDIHQSIRLIKRNRYDFINYKIRYQVGASLGNGRPRKLRDLAGDIYLDYKFKNGQL
jgi:hypothetical protein